MATRPGIPVTAFIGAMHPPMWDVDPTSYMRGQPQAFAWWQHRWPRGPETRPKGTPTYVHSRAYDRGGAAYAPQFGRLPINPIGAGVYAPYRIPTIAGPGARYVAGTIFFDVQSIPTSMPISPAVPIETVNALLATSRATGAYRTTG
jgi:hypothetical protein